MSNNLLKFTVTGLLVYLGYLLNGFLALQYPQYTHIFSKLAYVTTLVLLLSTLSDTAQLQDETKTQSPRFILGGFLASFAIISGLILAINPYGTVPWSQKDSYLSLGTRPIKLNTYQQSKKPVDILIFGSSAAFTISPDYVAQKFQASAFNFSVEGGSPVDFLAIYNFQARQRDAQLPKTVLVEIISPAIGVNVWELRIPIQLAGYLPAKYQYRLWTKFISNSNNIQTLSDSIYALRYPPTGLDIWKLHPDGLLEPIVPDRELFYRDASHATYMNMYATSLCNKLDDFGKNAVDDLVALSKKQGFGIVFYRSPRSIDFYKSIDTENAAYKTCNRLFEDYMSTLTTQNENVFFKDLGQYDPITSQGITTFIDYQHLAPKGAEMVIDALEPEIRSALEWAEKHQK